MNKCQIWGVIIKVESGRPGKGRDEGGGVNGPYKMLVKDISLNEGNMKYLQITIAAGP